MLGWRTTSNPGSVVGHLGEILVVDIDGHDRNSQQGGWSREGCAGPNPLGVPVIMVIIKLIINKLPLIKEDPDPNFNTGLIVGLAAPERPAFKLLSQGWR